MNEAAPAKSDVKREASSKTPRLHPAPGRCIVRIVKRLGLVGRLDGSEQSDAQTDAGIALALDGRYENQPMVGELKEIGDPTNEREREIAKWATEQAGSGYLFIFGYGAGTPYWNPHMEVLRSAGYDFTWLQGYRLLDIGQLACVVSGSGMYGEAPIDRNYQDLVLVAH